MSNYRNETGKVLLFTVGREQFRLEFFRAGGKGGQNQNKVSSACRITHLASRAIGESREERSQWQNRCIAFRRLADTSRFRTWLYVEAQRRLQHRDFEREVESMLALENLLVEVGDGAHWRPLEQEEALTE